MVMYKWSWDTYEWDHEFNVVQTVLMELNCIHAGFPRSQSHIWQSMVLHARMEAFSEVFAAIAIEWDGCSSVQGPRTLARDDYERRTAVRARLKRLESWGLWDGKWENLRNASCHVVEADAKLEDFGVSVENRDQS